MNVPETEHDWDREPTYESTYSLVAVLHVLITIFGLSDPTMVLPTDHRVYFDKAYFSFSASLVTLIGPVIGG